MRFKDIMKNYKFHNVNDMRVAMNLSFRDYERLSKTNPTLNRQTRNLLVACTILYENNLRVRLIRSIAMDKNIKEFDTDLRDFKRLISKNLQCLYCAEELDNNHKTYCCNACKQAAYRERKYSN